MKGKLRNKLLLYTTVTMLLASASAFIIPSEEKKTAKKPAHSILSDSLSSPSFIRNNIRYSRNYSFVKYDHNFVEWQDPASMATFFNKLKNSGQEKIKVLHIGDSHIQADIFTGSIRERLQEIFGYGGRGIVFPYAAAQTHSAYDYRTWRTGEWNYARNVNREPELELGISGVTIQTNDEKASFGINFYEGFIREHFTTVKIYCRKSAESFDLSFKYAPDAEPVIVDCNKTDGKPYTEVRIPKNSNTFEFSLVKNDPAQKSFECYGILIESSDDAGILYNSVGINGAGLKSILKSTRFTEQVQEMKPDLLLLDLGANDFYGGYYNEAELSADLNQIISMVKAASPSSSVIISCSQDIFRKKRDVAECSNYAMLTKHVAYDNSLAHYNYFQVSGGRYSMLKWQSHGLSKKDRVHLSNDGYQLKGELFANALLNSYYRYLLADGKRSLIVNDVMKDTSHYGYVSPFGAREETPLPDGSYEKEIDALKPRIKEDLVYGRTAKKLVYHKVRSGETIGQIASKYNASVSEVKKWNRMKGNTIRAGQKLKIYKTYTVTVSKSEKSKSGVRYHTVRRGETLSAIARKYGVSVEQIKKLSGIRGNAIKAGQRLRVR